MSHYRTNDFTAVRAHRRKDGVVVKGHARRVQPLSGKERQFTVIWHEHHSAKVFARSKDEAQDKVNRLIGDGELLPDDTFNSMEYGDVEEES